MNNSAPLPLDPIALDLKERLARILRGNQHVATIRIRVQRHRENYKFAGVTLMNIGDQPQASPWALHEALLALHHAGYIVYGSTSVALNRKLLDTGELAQRRA